DLMPTEPVDNALAIAHGEAHPLGFAPLVTPAGPSRPVARWPRAALAGALRARRPRGAINPQPQHRTAKTARRDLYHASINLRARRRHLRRAEACGSRVRDRVHALTPDAHPRALATQRRGGRRRNLSGESHCGLLHVTLEPLRLHASDRIEWRGPRTADLTREGGSLQRDSPHHRRDAAMHRATGGQQACTGGAGPMRSLLFLWRCVVHARLGYATGQWLP